MCTVDQEVLAPSAPATVIYTFMPGTGGGGHNQNACANEKREKSHGDNCIAGSDTTTPTRKWERTKSGAKRKEKSGAIKRR